MLTGLLAATLLGAAPGNGVVDGRFVLRTGEGPISYATLRRTTHDAPASIALRSGSTVYPAKLARDGSFSVEAPPGRYRIEYLQLGEEAEFFSPREVTIAAGEHACVGTFELTLANAEDLGANATSSLQVKDGCGARALPSALPTQVDPWGPDSKGPLDYLMGLRGGVVFSHDSWLSASYVLTVTGSSESGVLFGASAATTLNATTSISEASAGLGYRHLFIELLAGGGYANKAIDGSTGGPLAFASARMGNELMGIGARAELAPGGTRVALTLDLSPIALIGSLL